jgi:DNA-binding transcriptional regulator YdaS (Cro superfamily)
MPPPGAPSCNRQGNPVNSDPVKGLKKAIKAAGSQSALARLLGVAPQSVQEWGEKGYPPASRVLAIEAATGVSAHKLRSDLYPRRLFRQPVVSPARPPAPE